MRLTLTALGLLFTHWAFGQTTLPTSVFAPGSVQTPVAVGGASKQGTYGYSVVSGIPTENGDTGSNERASTLRLFEIWPDGSTKELGPAHSPHVDIRNLGGGRFSHRYSPAYNITYLIFSASDATDPRTNGRSYVVVQPGSNASTDSGGAFYDSQTKDKKYYLATSAPQQRTVVITNPSADNYDFTIAFNLNGFLQSRDDLKQEIQNQIPDYTGEPIERKIWNFVRHNQSWEVPYTAERWYHNPLLMFNSAGWALCDDAAAVLMHTAGLFGITGRVWGLHGHVVPELFVDGSWHMYDPTDQTIFQSASANGNVASVSELIADHSLVLSPVTGGPWVPFTSKLNVAGNETEVISKEEYAGLYSADDVVSTWYNKVPVTEIPLVFDLPARGSVEIGSDNLAEAPTKFDGPVKSVQKAFSNVKVTLPQGSTGDLNVFLIPYKITGNGSATLYFEDNTVKTVAISASSNWNQSDANDRNAYIKRINYTAGSGGLIIHYLANPIRSAVKNFNSVVLSPYSAASKAVANPLTVNLKTVP